MGYADPDKQREYQRKWSKNINSRKYKPKANLTERYDNSFDLKKRLVTFKELTNEHFDEIKTYDECVKKAKNYVHGRRINRIAIASLAIRACEIKHGGNMKLIRRDKTLKAFGEKIKINPHTLWGWIGIKRNVIDKLPQEIKTIDWTAATYAARTMKQSGESPKESYERYMNINPVHKGSNLMCVYLRNVLNQINHHGLRNMPKTQVKEAKITLGHINDKFKAIKINENQK